MNSAFPQPDVDVSDDILIGAALLAPSFCEDLSTWRMTVAWNGTVTQELRIASHSELYDTVCVQLQSFAPSSVIAKIKTTAQTIEFSRFKDDYHASCTDLQYTSITLNLNSKPQRVTAYGPQLLAHDGDSDMIGYMQLWDIILDISPYQSTKCQAAPEDQVRKRIRSIFGPMP